MPSKSKAQRAFLIKVVADEDFAKSRKMNQDVARDILNEDEEHIAKDKHWADKLPDRASSSMESLDTWHNPEFIRLITDQTVHPSFESLTDKFKSMFDKIRGKSTTSPAQNAVIVAKVNYDVFYPKSGERVVKTGTGDFTALAAQLRMRSTSSPFWATLIKSLDDYIRTISKVKKDATEYCDKCEKIYKKCETMQPEAAYAYAQVEMKKIGLEAPNKAQLPMADFEYISDKYGSTHGLPIPIQTGRVMCEYPTEAQLKKLIDLARTLYEQDFDYESYWTLDDTDEVKWWSHHFPMDDEHWGPMLGLFPYAGEVRNFDSQAVGHSWDVVVKGMVKVIEAVSVPKAAAE